MNTTERFTELTNKLREIFQLDTEELDFGLYKILKIRNAEIKSFLENVLKNDVKVILTQLEKQEIGELVKNLHGMEHNLRDAGIEPNQAPKYVELKSSLEAQQNKLSDAEGIVYTHLLTFFSRYYDNGDFISKRRIKKGDAYAIPYNGEEVKLHWANADQYYVKSGENFKNYDFLLENGNRVRFKLVSAATNKDNVKDADATRCFVLWAPPAIENQDDGEEEAPHEEYPADFLEVIEQKDETGKVASKELVLYFQYVKFPKGTKQKELNQKALVAIIERMTEKSLLTEFPVDEAEPKSSKDNKKSSVLEYQLNRYTGKNSSDFFIHKDLGGFLTKELDFYIKNEMMNLDDIENADTFNQIEGNFALIKAVRAIALKIIAFLAQVENFQKKLWLKKKFVVQCNYCITLDRVDPEFYKEIFDNKKQLDAWRKLGFPEELLQAPEQIPARPGEMTDTSTHWSPSAYLMVDTQYFSSEFKQKLLASIDNLDEQCDGLLIHSENFQALNLLQERYREQVKCIYIDPPYNTEDNDFIYKDQYQHSSWLSMMKDRIQKAYLLLRKDSTFFSSLDFHEIANAKKICELIFQQENFEGIISWKRRCNQPNDKTKMLGITSEYILSYAKNSKKYKEAGVGKVELTGEFSNPDNDPRGEWASKPWKVGSDQNGSRYKIISPSGIEYDEEWMGEENTYKELLKDGRIYFPKKTKKVDGCPRKKYYRFEREEEGQCATNFWDSKQFGHNQGANATLFNLMGEKNTFSNPKPVELIRGILQVSNIQESQMLLDFFAGSGTTGHAVINLNREDGGKCKYILCEMGEYFDTVLKPRIEKVVFSKEWKGGKPEAQKGSYDGISHCFKYMTLESYEDTLTNLEKMEQKGQKLMPLLQSEYVMKYMLDIESHDSLLSTDIFRKPFDYKLDIAVDASGATRPQSVDLVETFNYLIGLTVESIDYKVEQDGKTSLITVIGSKPNNERVLVLWRDCDIWTYEKLNDYLDTRQIKANSEFSTIYVNGDHSIKNAINKTNGNEAICKIQNIENEFFKQMFGEE